jgi:hypothetical protein
MPGFLFSIAVEGLNAWPSKVAGPMLDSGDGRVDIEAMTLEHEGLENEGMARPRDWSGGSPE